MTFCVNLFPMSDEKRRRVLEAAKAAFLRYGYRRVTMGEIAKEAGMSRPALYLVYPDKAAIFRAVVEEHGRSGLDEIRRGLDGLESIQAKLELITQIWTIRPYTEFHDAPDAQELMDVGHEIAGEVIRKVYGDFEDLLTSVFESEKRALKSAGLTPRVLARILSLTLRGLKEWAEDLNALKQHVRGLIRMTLATLGVAPKPAGRAR